MKPRHLLLIYVFTTCFRRNIAAGGHMESCDTSCWCDSGTDSDGWCDDSCSVDCGAKVQEACKKFASAQEDTLIFALDSFKKANGSIDQFERILNDTLMPYFEQKSKECENTAGTQCSLIAMILSIMMFNIV